MYNWHNATNSCDKFYVVCSIINFGFKFTPKFTQSIKTTQPKKNFFLEKVCTMAGIR